MFEDSKQKSEGKAFRNCKAGCLLPATRPGTLSKRGGWGTRSSFHMSLALKPGSLRHRQVSWWAWGLPGLYKIGLIPPGSLSGCILSYRHPPAPWALPFWEGHYHFHGDPGKLRILTRQQWGKGRLMGKVPTCQIFISFPLSVPWLQTPSADRRVMLILDCMPESRFPSQNTVVEQI